MQPLTGKAASIARNEERKKKSTSARTPLVAGAKVGLGGSARGDDFASSAIDSGRVGEFEQIEVPTKPRSKKQLQSSTFSTAGSGSPTVFSNANKIERVVPLLNNRTSNLSSFNLSGGDTGRASFTGIDDTAGVGGDTSNEESTFDEILGLTGDKKKKKKNEIPAYTALEQQQLGLLNQMKNTQDRRLRQSINDTQQVFSERKKQQEAAAASGLNTIRNVLNLAGSSRYAPISSQGLISTAEAAGIKALADLDSLEQKTVAEIQDARDNLDYQTLEKKFDFLDGIRKNKQVAADELDTAVKEQETQIQNDTAIAELISQGMTDPIEMFQSLRASGNNIPLSTITASLGDIAASAQKVSKDSRNLLDEKMYLKLAGVPGMTNQVLSSIENDLNAGFSVDEVLGNLDASPEEIGAVKQALGISAAGSAAATVGKGVKTQLEESLVRTRLFSKIAPILNKGALSESDREIIDGRIAEFRDAGMGEQEILDAIAGIPPEVISPYNSRFRDLIVSNSDTTEKQTQNIGRLSQQLSAGNHMAAMNTVENLALENAKKVDPDGYVGPSTAQNFLKKSKTLEELLATPGIEAFVGPLEGTFENIKGKFRSAEAQKLRSAITDLVKEMRKDLSGSAVTENESKFLEPLIPSLSDKWENLSQKNTTLKNGTLDRYNSVRSSVSLPTVTAEQVIDPKKRLGLYSSDTYLPKDGNLDL